MPAHVDVVVEEQLDNCCPQKETSCADAVGRAFDAPNYATNCI